MVGGSSGAMVDLVLIEKTEIREFKVYYNFSGFYPTAEGKKTFFLFNLFALIKRFLGSMAEIK